MTMASPPDRPSSCGTFRNRQVAIWDPAEVLADPTLVKR